MITNVKMHVTPDLSQRVQEIVFAHGGGWLEELEAKIKYLTAPYIYLDCNKQLTYGTLLSTYKTHDFKEISAYDFIASQGQQEWLPKYGEKVLLSDDNVHWKGPLEFITYLPNSLHCFMTRPGSSYTWCKLVPKPKIITIDGIDIEINAENFEVLKQQICKG